MCVYSLTHLQVLLWLLRHTPHTWLSKLLSFILPYLVYLKDHFISQIYLYLYFADSHLWEKHTTKVENTKMPWSCIIWTGWSKKLRIWSTKQVRTLHFSQFLPFQSVDSTKINTLELYSHFLHSKCTWFALLFLLPSLVPGLPCL